MSPSTMPWPVKPWAQTRGAFTFVTFHSMVSLPFGVVTGFVLGSRDDLTHGLPMIWPTSGRAARAFTTARLPVTRSRFMIQWDLYVAPIRLRSVLMGAWVRLAKARSESNTNVPLASLVGIVAARAA